MRGHLYFAPLKLSATSITEGTLFLYGLNSDSIPNFNIQQSLTQNPKQIPNHFIEKNKKCLIFLNPSSDTS